jgi:hypothetical protein
MVAVADEKEEGDEVGDGVEILTLSLCRHHLLSP